MSYQAENYQKVQKRLAERRAAAVAAADENRLRLHTMSKDAADIDRALSETGRNLFRIACEGGPDMREKINALKEQNLSLQEARRTLLATLGLPKDYTEPQYTCGKCSDAGFLKGKMCECMRKELAEEGFRSSGIGALIDRQSFDNFSLDYYSENADTLSLMRYAYDTCRRYADGFRVGAESLLLMGGTGLGKTHLSTAIARRVIERGYEVVYESAPNILADFDYDRFRLRGDEEPRAEKYLTADLLIIDDLGTEVSTRFTVSHLYNLINTRINRALPTVVSTNLSQRELSEQYDDRIVSRLFGEFTPILFRGEDVRKQKLM